MEDRHIAEHFVVAGLPPDNLDLLEEFSCDGASLKTDHSLPPITDIGVVNTSLGEEVPDGYTLISTTPSGGSANLNLGVFRAPEMYLCYKRGTHQPPLVDIGVLYDGREKVMVDSQMLQFTVGNHSANINPHGYTTYITYRRSSPDRECNELVVSDICVKNKEPAPHSFCTIDRNINKNSMMGAEVYICYRKSVNRPTYIAYKPALLDNCSPTSRKPSFSLPADLALFCVPMGATLESWPPQTKVPEPVFSTFVLTVTSPQSDQVDKVYCAGVTFYERYDHAKLSLEQATQLKLKEHDGFNNLVYTNKSICLLSLWPFFDTFETFLKYLHQMVHSGPHNVPIERYIYHLLESVPFPSVQRPRILVQLDAHTCMTLSLPEDSPIALSGARFRDLISLLRPNACLQLLVFALTEQKVLLHSLRPAVLTAATEALAMIIFPFHWQCPYIPLCPLGLSSFLNAPIPFLLGLDSRFFDMYHPPQDVICVDLDTGAISIPEDKRAINEKLLPKRCSKALKFSLEDLCTKCFYLESYKERVLHKQKLAAAGKAINPEDSPLDAAFKIRRMEQELEVEIQEAFLTFTASLLHGYSSFLLPIASRNLSPDTANLFDIEGFVKSRDRSYQKFYSMLVSTQMFSKFIEERSFVSDKDASLAFFDDCVERVAASQASGEPLGRLLEVESGNSEHTFVLPPPEPPPATAPGTTWSYDHFPHQLDKSLLSPPSPQKAAPRLMPPSGAGSVHPPSPMARRSKQELRSAQKQASKLAQTPLTWAKCLVSTSYSVWYTQLSSFALTHQHGSRVLHLAYRVLLHIQSLAQHNTDEVSYRIMMQLCGVYSQPELAMRVLCAMNTVGISPNAITYGYYNRAVLECKWTHAYHYWNKLRNVVSGVAAFRSSGRDRAARLGPTTRRSEGRHKEAAQAAAEDHKTAALARQEKPEKTSVQSNDSRDTSRSRDKLTEPDEKFNGASTKPSDSHDVETRDPLSAESEGLANFASKDPLNISNSNSPAEAADSSSLTGTDADLCQSSLATEEEEPPAIAVEVKSESLGDHDRSSGHSRAAVTDTNASCSSEVSDDIRLACVMASTTLPVVHSAGLVMTSPLDDAVFQPSQRHRSRPTDLAHALTPTLRNYDQMSEPSVPRSCEHSSNMPEYLRNAQTGGDGKIMNRLWSLASSYIPTAYVDSSYTTPVSSVNNTPKRAPPKRDGLGERWERSIERWDNSPKMARSREKMSSQNGGNVKRDLSGSRKCHVRSDSGSSLGSLGELNTGPAEVPGAKPLPRENNVSAAVKGTCAMESGPPLHASHNGTVAVRCGTAKTEQYENNCDVGREKADGKSPSDDSLSAIVEEDLSAQNGGQARNFFSRNAPERLSSLFKKSVGGADEKLKGLWRRGVTRSGSKDSMKSNPSSTGSPSPVTTPGSEKPVVGSPSASSGGTPARSPKKKSPQTVSSSKSSMRLTNSSTDKELFLKGEQPRLFQTESPEQYETPPTSPLKSACVAPEPKLPPEPIIVPVAPGRHEVILGDPLGALDSPTNSPSTSPNMPTSLSSFQLSADKSSHDSILVIEDDPTLRPAAILNHARASQATGLSYDLNLRVSTVKRTVLPPLSSREDDEQPNESREEFSDPLLHPPRSDPLPQSSSSSSLSLSSETATAQVQTISWSISPLGSPFSVPIPIPMNNTQRSATIPRSSAEPSSPLKTLPPLAPKTPNHSTQSSATVSGRLSRSVHRQLLQQTDLKGKNVRSSSTTSSSTPSSDYTETDGREDVQQRGRRSSIGGGSSNIAGRTSNSLTSLSTVSASDTSEDGLSHRGHRRRGSDLASRHAATLESNYTPSMWSQFSSGGLSGRKSELFTGGMNSFRRVSSAVSSIISKKVRQSMSANNTPTRAGAITASGGAYGSAWRSVDAGEDDDALDGFFSSRRRESAPSDASGALAATIAGSDELLMSQPMASALSAGGYHLPPNYSLYHNPSAPGASHQHGGPNTGQLFDAFSAGPAWEARGPYCIGVEMTSCSKCHNCHTLLYDEEIMAGWSADDSNLNTKCRYCDRDTVPVLTITVYDLLHLPKSEAPGVEAERQRTSSADGARSSANSLKDEIFKNVRSKSCGREPMTVAYLSPLVLRKELESMLTHEGDDVLTQPSCPEKHPILYWNMLWYFTRLGLPSQLSGLCLAATLATDSHRLHPSWCSNSATNNAASAASDVAASTAGAAASNEADASASAPDTDVTSAADVSIVVAPEVVIDSHKNTSADTFVENTKNILLEQVESGKEPETLLPTDNVHMKDDIMSEGVNVRTVPNGDLEATILPTNECVSDNSSKPQEFSDRKDSILKNLVCSKTPTELPSTCVSNETRDQTPGTVPDAASTPTALPLQTSSSKPKLPDWRNVFVICMWDCPLYHQEIGPPLYLQQRQRGASSLLVRGLVNQPLLIDENILQSILTLILVNDLQSAIKMFAQELRKRPTNLQQRRLPLYRDLLLFASDAISHPAVNMVAFEQRFRAAYDSLDPSIAGLFTPADSAPPLAANFAKRCFPPLSL
ncbi:DENN domain-containing protein Crag isoform X2 [Hyalella azteca]|uniref:DENN domain-containing protein Crag isoform X2 n=1 Tax=Hyalella azteca TaxID=294128 RepID=A0A979FQ14_HYAAZ|nr:DENN domain-containing protein Crag isoform X2 [Hyalella azteca]